VLSAFFGRGDPLFSELFGFGADGTIWQRKDWNFLEVKESIKIAVSTPWGTEMCRGL
jgi:hypothetical protein